jgi:sortase A
MNTSRSPRRSRPLTHTDVVRVFGTSLLATGLGLLVFVVWTVLAGDPFTGIEAGRAQSQLQRDLQRRDAAFATGTLAATTAPDPRVTRVLARRYRRSLNEGDAAGTLEIPHIHLRKVIVSGANPKDLAKGPGLYAQSTMPGSGGAVAIAGHRTTHGAPFLDIDKIRVGDHIYVTVPYGTFDYVVSKRRIISPNDWSILQPGAAERSKAAAAMQLGVNARCPRSSCEFLVLTACHPKYSAARRYAVLAQLRGQRLRGAGA